jgi:hypothetical protein
LLFAFPRSSSFTPASTPSRTFPRFVSHVAQASSSLRRDASAWSRLQATGHTRQQRFILVLLFLISAAAAAAAAAGSSSSSSSSSSPAAAAAASSSSSASSSADADEDDDEDDEDYEEAEEDDEEEEEEDSAPVGSVLPSRFLAVALRWLLQDLNPGLYSIPFMPTPLVDLIASYAAEDDLSQQALSVRIDHASVHDLTLHSTSGPDCVEEMVEDLDWRDGDREDETVTELASLYAQLDTPEAKEWKAAEGLASDVNEQNAYEEAQGWSSEQQGEAATRMARALVAASKAPPATVHPSLAAFLAHHPQVLLSIRERTARLRSPPESALALWGKQAARRVDLTHLTSFSSICPLTGQIKVSVRTHGGDEVGDRAGRKAQDEAAAAERRTADSTPPPYVKS